MPCLTRSATASRPTAASAPATWCPHELNFRLHPDLQRAALPALYEEVGFARSLLAYELPDGRLKLIDGHLRRDLDPDMEVDVEILDVNDEEARALLLSIDPLAALAETQDQLHQRLLELTPPVPEDLQAAWQAAAEASLEAVDGPRPRKRWPGWSSSWCWSRAGMRSSRSNCFSGCKGKGWSARRCWREGGEG